MSGIAGIIHFDGKPIEPGLIEKMTGAMAHRGPDGINHWVKGSVALGQCMLRTTPESLEEHQPLTNEDESLVLVMDGRVDNWVELRRELLGRGAMLRNRADVELVLRAYEIWGEECPDRIIGEYVFFIWDARQRRLFGARDAAGTRHFYYHASNGWFSFASEIKGLLALERIEPRLNESRLLDYLVEEFDRDDEVGTFYQDINRMPAGHAMWATSHGPRTWRYWNPGNLPAISFSSLDECAEEFLEQFRVAVKCRLRSIGSIGAMLSGGLDSSSIVGLISKDYRDDLRQPLCTFSLIRYDRENCSDWLSIQEILRENDWIEPIIIAPDIVKDICRFYLDSIQYLNEPFALSQGFTDSLIFEAARKKGCCVVFDGMAGDLLFYSPRKSLSSVFSQKRFRYIPDVITAYRQHGIKNWLQRLVLVSLYSAMPEGVLAIYRICREFWRKNEAIRDKRFKVAGDLKKLLHQDVAQRFLEMKYSQRQRANIQANLSNDQCAHAFYFTTGLLSFAHEVNGQIALSKQVEPRSPFSDRRLIEFAIRMPLEAKLSRKWYKYTLRSSMASLLPEDVRWRRTFGEHPGWQFHKYFILEIERIAPGIWSYSYLNDLLHRWIDPLKLKCAWEEYHCSNNYTIGANLLTLTVLAQWLNARFH